MTIPEDKMLKVLVSVGEDEVGGKFITPEEYPSVSEFVDAIYKNSIEKVVQVTDLDKIYDIGSKFNSKTNKFAKDSATKHLHLSSDDHVFLIIADSTVVYIDILRSPQFDGMIAAYQSNPTFTFTEVKRGQYR
jgi:hypothetical protein